MRKILFILLLLLIIATTNAQNGFFGSYVYGQGKDLITLIGGTSSSLSKFVTYSGNQIRHYSAYTDYMMPADSSNTYIGQNYSGETHYIETDHNDLRSFSILAGENLSNLNVSECRRLQYLYITDAYLPSSVNVSNLHELKQIYLNSNTSNGTIDLSNNGKLEFIGVYNDPITNVIISSPELERVQISGTNLATISLGIPNPMTGLIFLTNNKLIQSEVDEVLKWCVDGGRTSSDGNCSVSLDGVTNSCPSTSGISYAKILTNRGWAVSYNQCGGTNTPPTVTTSQPTYVSINSATSGGVVTSAGSSSVSARGVCWSTSQNPTVSNDKTTNGTGVGSFTSSITSLVAGTTYYVRAYATNSYGTSYGNQYTFTTLAEFTNPTVITTMPYGVSTNTATSGGHITSDGGGEIIEKGVCYSTSPTPTYAGNKTNEGSGIADFTSTITGLSANTTYYIRAYARNRILSGGFYIYALGYGQEETFTTTGSGTLPTVQTYIANTITSSSAYSGGNVISDGESSVTLRGVVWSAYSNPTRTSFPTGGNMPSGSGAGSFITQMPNLYSGTIYYYKAYAVNSSGTAYGDELNFTTTIEPTPQSYGYLYNWWAAIGDTNGDGASETSIANSGWHVASDSEWNTLISYLGASTAGSKLKTSGTIYWASPNTGTNTSLFNARGSGYRVNTGGFADLQQRVQYWTSTQYNSTDGVFAGLIHDYTEVFVLNANKKYGHTIRLIKDYTTLSNGQTGTYVGNDGRIYSTICIGTQEWISSDLLETTFRNGTIIEEVQNSSTWSSLTSAARCYYVP